MVVTQGRRVYIGDAEYKVLELGDYGKDKDGVWWIRPPHVPGKYWGVGNISSHQVTEHEDGTITVTPSILVYGHHGAQWHGYLRAGVWEEI